MQFSASSADACRPAPSSGRCRGGPGGIPEARRRGRRRSISKYKGSSSRPCDERGRTCKKTSRSCQVGHDLLDPHHRRSSTLGRVRHIRPLPSRLDDADRLPVSATAKFTPADGHRRGLRNLLAEVGSRAAPASAFGLVGEGRSGPEAWSSEQGADLRARFLWIAGTRMCDDRSPESWMMSSARSVSVGSIPRREPGRR